VLLGGGRGLLGGGGGAREGRFRRGRVISEYIVSV
jgi:hypothetical protein